MRSIGFGVIMAFIAAGIAAGCASSPTPAAPTHPPFVLPTLIPPTRIPPSPTPSPTATWTSTSVPPTATLTSTPLSGLSQNAGISGAITPSAVPASQTPTATRTLALTATPAATPTPAIPPGLYVTDMRIEPPPQRGPDLTFYPTFLNTLGREQNYRWSVYIFRADTQKRIGDTSFNNDPIPTGNVEQRTNGSWHWPLGGPCEYFYAQIGWTNDENKIIWFTTTNGAIFQKGFTACPP